jgi:hypothetical protein
LQGAVEAFHFAVGLSPVGAGALVGDARGSQVISPEFGFVAAAVEFLMDVTLLEGS